MPMIEDPPPAPYIEAPPEVWRGSSEAEIDRFNARPGIVRYTTPEQDQRLIQRNIDEENVALGIDPLKARKVKADAEEAAVRFAGQREFNQLVSAGAMPEEALRRTASKMFFNHPDKMALALSRLPAPGSIPSQLQAVPIMGAGGEQIGSSVFTPQGRLHASTFTKPGALTPDELAQRQLAGKDIDAMNRELTSLKRARMDALNAPQFPQIDRQIGDLQARIDATKQTYLNPRAKVEAPAEVKESKVEKKRNEVVRMYKGKRAIFDADTKEFIRYQ